MNEELKEPESLDAADLDATDETSAAGPGGAAAPVAGEPAAAEDDGFAMSPAEEKLAEANDRYLRLMADFDNFRKRAAKERLDAQAYAVEDVIREVIPVIDNLERALAASQEGTGAEGVAGVVKGVELTLRMFQGVLAKFGVERIKAAGEPFDPNRHEALMQVESEDVAVETVAEEFEPGYMVRGRIVRPARVKVLKPKPAATAA